MEISIDENKEPLSFIDPGRGVFGEIFPEVMIFISSLKEIFRRIPRAVGL